MSAPLTAPVMRRLCYGAVCSALALSLNVNAEVVFDGSTGPGGSLSGLMIIPDSQGTTVGGNLFHSFSTFNVNTGEGALFTGPASIQNILNRVTGASASNIDGFIEHNMPGAGFWLINPNGIVFGENASLPTSGAFHASTADYLELEDGGRFGADLSMPGNTVLTLAPPSAFGFLDANVAPITVNQSSLQVPLGETLSLVGGDVAITGGPLGYLAAPGGTINIASVKAAGEAPIGNDGVDITSFEQRGDISLSQDGFVSISDGIYGEPGAGSLYIRGGRFFMDDSRIFGNTYEGVSGSITIETSDGFDMGAGSAIESSSWDSGRSPDIELVIGGDLTLAGGSDINSSANHVGDSGSITVSAANVHVTESSRIWSVANAAGHAGDVTVTAADTISIDGDFYTRIGSDSFAVYDLGYAGDVTLSAQTITVNGGVITTESGSLSLGAAGDLNISAENLQLSNDALVSSASRGFGPGGAIVLQATNAMTLSGASSVSSTTSGISEAGDIRIVTPELTLSEQSLISASTFQHGDAGDIDIQVGRLRLSNSNITADTTPTLELPTGAAGNITIDASESVALVNDTGDWVFKPRISSTTFGSGDGGSISISTPDLMVSNGSIDANTMLSSGAAGDIVINVDTLVLQDFGIVSSDVGDLASGNGGSININARESITVAGEVIIGDGAFFYSNISTSTLGQGDAGTIELSSPQVDLVTGYISATTLGSGAAGSITLNQVDSLTLTAGGHIQAGTLGAGAGGDINIEAGSIMATGIDPNDEKPGGIFATTRASGAGGSINLDSEKISISDGATIRSNATDTGDAGSISIAARDELTLQAGTIETSSDLSSGGNITVAAGNLVYLLDSAITAEAQGVSPGNDGGNVTIDPTFIVLNNSEVVARANAGNGGNIELSADALIVDTSSVIDASSATGIDGHIIIETPDRDISGDVVALDTPVMDVSELLLKRCAAASLQDRSSFTVVTSGGLANSPDVYAGGVYAPPVASQGEADSALAPGLHARPATLSLATAFSQWGKNDCYY